MSIVDVASLEVLDPLRLYVPHVILVKRIKFLLLNFISIIHVFNRCPVVD